MPPKIFPAYLFLGEEIFLKEEEIEKLKSSCLDPSVKDLDYEVFFAKDKDFQFDKFCDSLNTAPFFSRKRVVVLKDADSLASAFKESIILYLDKPIESSVLIIEDPAANIKGGFLLDASKRSHLVYFRKLISHEMDKWIIKKTDSYGKKISGDALIMLKGCIPNGLKELSYSLEKLALYAGNRQSITRQDVEAVIGINPPHTAFDLIGCIEKKDAKKALQVFASLKKDKKRETELVGLLAWNIRMLLRVKELSGIKDRLEICRDLGIHPRQCDQFILSASGFKKGRILEFLDEILDSDIAIKTGSNPRDVIERLIVKMCVGKSTIT